MRWRYWILPAAIAVLAGCSGDNTSDDDTVSVVGQERNTVFNGDSQHEASCALLGGTMALSRQLNGDSIGTCQLANGKRCDESALTNGTCPAG